MTTPARILPSWRDGATREAIVAFLDASDSLPPEVKVAAFDNDGTLWCERPAYAQFLFYVDQLHTAAQGDPALAQRAEYAAVLAGDHAAIGELGLARVALALGELFESLTPDEFSARVRDFMGRAQHPTLGIPLRRAIYQPMLELIAELRARGFSIFVVSGGGIEFVRAISYELYGVLPDGVVGTQIEHEMHRDEVGRPVLRRTNRLIGGANEGAEKVTRIQSHLGRRPILAAGNTGGDREMLEWTVAGDGPTLALLVDHDDAEREFAYQGSAESFAEAEPIGAVASRLGWTVASVANDWDTVFPPAD